MVSRKTQLAWMGLGAVLCLVGLILAMQIHDGSRAAAQDEERSPTALAPLVPIVMPPPSDNAPEMKDAEPSPEGTAPMTPPQAPAGDPLPAIQPVSASEDAPLVPPAGGSALPPIPEPISASGSSEPLPVPPEKVSSPDPEKADLTAPPPGTTAPSSGTPADLEPAAPPLSQPVPAPTTTPPAKPEPATVPAAPPVPVAPPAPAEEQPGPAYPAPAQSYAPPVPEVAVPAVAAPMGSAPLNLPVVQKEPQQGVRQAVATEAAPIASVPFGPTPSAPVDVTEPPLAPPPGPVQSYEVRRQGESMKEIARRTLGSSERWEDIFKLNPRLRPEEVLSIGTVVRLPADACIPTEDVEAVRPLPALKPDKVEVRPPVVLPLTGTFPCTLDNNHGMTLPRAIREQLGFCDTVLISPGPDHCLWVTNQSHLNRLADRLEKSDAREADVRVFKRLYYAQTEKMPVTGDGRVIISDRLAQFAGLSQEVVLVGIDDHFELWDVSRWRQYTQAKSAASRHTSTVAER